MEGNSNQPPVIPQQPVQPPVPSQPVPPPVLDPAPEAGPPPIEMPEQMVPQGGKSFFSENKFMLVVILLILLVVVAGAFALKIFYFDQASQPSVVTTEETFFETPTPSLEPAISQPPIENTQDLDDALETVDSQNTDSINQDASGIQQDASSFSQ